MEHGTCSCTACTAAARVRDRDAWGRTPAGRLRTTLPRPCRARHALRDARRGGGAHRLLVLVAHSGSPKTARANYAPKTLPLWQGAKAESAQRACLSAAAGCGQRCRARPERRERRDGRAREAAPAHVHASAGWMTSACKDSPAVSFHQRKGSWHRRKSPGWLSPVGPGHESSRRRAASDGLPAVWRGCVSPAGCPEGWSPPS